MYEIQITTSDNDIREFFNSKHEVVRFIARETGMSQREVSSEIDAKANSSITRDNLGFRVNVSYS